MAHSTTAASVETCQKRLAAARDSRDRQGQRREHVNLAHACLAGDDFDAAVQNYRDALNIGESTRDGIFVAQMNFILGRIYHVKRDYDRSIVHHEKHLQLARDYRDARGQCQACAVLSELNEKINQSDKSKKYLIESQSLARDESNTLESKKAASKNLRHDSRSASLSDSSRPYLERANAAAAATEKSPLTTSKKSRMNFMQHLTKKSPLAIRKESAPADHDDLDDLVHRMQRSRFDDQRCTIQSNARASEARSSTQLDEIINSLDRLQQTRLDDQRTTLNQPAKSRRLSPLNEHFFDQLAKSQESRLDDQRATLQPNSNHRTPSAVQVVLDSSTLPDAAFFSILEQVQSRRP